MRELLGLFKGCGRFQSPIEEPLPYKLDDLTYLRPLMNKKPAVVLEHLKTHRALPILADEGKDVHGKLIRGMDQQLRL